MAKMFLISGEKGGVGKSTACIHLIEALRAAGMPPVIYDGDPVNPDVLARYHDALAFDIASPQAWGEVLEAAGAGPIVVNLPARGGEVLESYADAFKEAANALGVEVTYLHVMNRQKDSLMLLASAVERLGGVASVYAVRNLYFGEQSKFTLFNNSKTRQKVAGEINLPELADHVADAMQTAPKGQLPLETGEGLKIFDREILKKWLRQAGEVWAPVL